MKVFVRVILVVLLGFSSLFANTPEYNKIIESSTVLKKMLNLPENAIPPLLFKKAEAIAIIPSTYKVGFLLGVRYGNGVLCVKDEKGVWGNPIFISLVGGSFGFQIGASSSDIVLAFKNKRSISGLISSKFTLGVDASIAAGPVGREASASSDLFLESEVYTYALSKGLYAGIALSGSSIMVDELSNEHFYGENISPTDIMNNYKIQVPEVAKRFKILFNGK